MRNADTGWQWFKSASDATPPGSDVARNFVQCFASNAGAHVLHYLQTTILQRVLPASATREELFYHEGQRATAALVMTMIARGKTDPLSQTSQP